jgi:plastocyanin
MRIQRLIPVLAVTAGLITGAIAFGCSKSSSPTSPGGGGGGGNTAFDTGIQSSGFAFSKVFPAAGTVQYHCTPHQASGMTGTITISSSAAVSSVDVTVAPSGTLTFSPSSVSIKPGGSVNWTWASSGHTVTSGTITAATP